MQTHTHSARLNINTKKIHTDLQESNNNEQHVHTHCILMHIHSNSLSYKHMDEYWNRIKKNDYEWSHNLRHQNKETLHQWCFSCLLIAQSTSQHLSHSPIFTLIHTLTVGGCQARCQLLIRSNLGFGRLRLANCAPTPPVWVIVCRESGNATQK